MIKESIGFIGAGKMAEALVRGIIKSKAAAAKSITVSDKDGARLKHMTKEYKVSGEKKNVKLVKDSDIIILAVKPNNMGAVLDEVKDAVDETKVIISIAAGITEEFIRKRLSLDVQPQIVRVMPNAPAQVMLGATGIYFNENCKKAGKESTIKLFDSVGFSFVLEDEALLDAVTALSGSGPAYIFYIIQALSDAGVSVGLGRDLALKLALQTTLGAVQMAISTNAHPAILQESVTSPGGTTIKALEVLDEDGVKGSLIKAVNIACERSKKLSRS